MGEHLRYTCASGYNFATDENQDTFEIECSSSGSFNIAPSLSAPACVDQVQCPSAPASLPIGMESNFDDAGPYYDGDTIE